MRKKKNTFPFPLPAKARSLFAKLAVSISPEEIPGLRQKLILYQNRVASRFEEAKKKGDTGFEENFRLGLRLIEIAFKLLDSYSSFDEQHRSWIIGAINYLLETKDSNEDFRDPFGLDDDLGVINGVLSAIGKHEYIISRK